MCARALVISWFGQPSKLMKLWAKQASKIRFRIRISEYQNQQDTKASQPKHQPLKSIARPALDNTILQPRSVDADSGFYIDLWLRCVALRLFHLFERMFSGSRSISNRARDHKSSACFEFVLRAIDRSQPPNEQPENLSSRSHSNSNSNHCVRIRIRIRIQHPTSDLFSRLELRISNLRSRISNLEHTTQPNKVSGAAANRVETID